MQFEVTVPEQFMGDVINDLNRRSAEISDVGGDLDLRVLKGNVPLSKMFGYTTALRSMTQGRGQHSMEPHKFQEVPPEEVKKRFGDFI